MLGDFRFGRPRVERAKRIERGETEIDVCRWWIDGERFGELYDGQPRFQRVTPFREEFVALGDLARVILGGNGEFLGLVKDQ